MLLWFVGTSIVAIWFVFRDPRFDHRLLIVGALVPPLIDAPSGGAWVMHSLVASVVLMIAVMLVTLGRRPIRRTLLGLPLGTFLHLVFTGAWTATTVFWWPFSGWTFDGTPIPAFERGWLNLPLEFVGGVLIWWIVRAADLRDPDARHRFWTTGRLDIRTGRGPTGRC